MSLESSQPPASAHASAPAREVLVWDLPTRLFHWLLAASFLGAYVISEGERWRAIHAMLGYTAAGLIAFRLLWGVVGTRYARFTGFAWAPRAVGEYLRSLLTATPRHYVGHNPAGSWAIIALLAGVAATAATGWAVFNDVGPGWMEDAHEVLANATIALVAFHVAAVVVSSLLHRENLARAMVTGVKRARDAVPAAGNRWPVGIALVGALVAFWVGWIPAPGLAPGIAASSLTSPNAAIAKHPGRESRRERDRHEADERSDHR